MKPPHSSSREMPHPAQAGVSPIIAIKTMAKYLQMIPIKDEVRHWQDVVKVI
jgi:hypothetical protein